ncbi:hypothetical protein OIV83_003877 [Microbotryomycetes sp. JL201]|nr:hypothetical protein OIV83_003877 [Microbotryomycetes sp. JL201]
MQLEIDDPPPLPDSPAIHCLECGRSDIKLMQCSKCHKAGKQALYCTRSCQVANYSKHKQGCGDTRMVDENSTFKHSLALRNQLACLGALKDTATGISYLYYPFSPISNSPPPDPRPVVLPLAARAVFDRLFRQANSTRNSTAINLMFSLLSDVVTQSSVNGTEQRLIEQLSEEYEVNLNEMLEHEVEPTEDELTEAIGGTEGLGDLLQWQLAEASGSRGTGA